MGAYQKDLFELLVRRDIQTFQFKLNERPVLAMEALGGVEKPLARELHRCRLISARCGHGTAISATHLTQDYLEAIFKKHVR
ncbi:hypothetical protein EMIT0P2_20015 [Pseudomonas sp. IT-P2]